MKLYHVTRDLRHNGMFVPRIPECAYDNDECVETRRICFSPTIEMCLTALPIGVLNLKDELEYSNSILKVFVLDTKKYNIADEAIIDYNYLMKHDLVQDADLTKEHWVLEEVHIKMEDAFFIEILDFDIIKVNLLRGQYVVPDYSVGNLTYSVEEVEEGNGVKSRRTSSRLFRSG